MPTAYRRRKALTSSALILAVTGLPLLMPFSAGASMVLLDGGYFLIVDSAIASLLMGQWSSVVCCSR